MKSLLTGTYAFRQKGTGIAPPNWNGLLKPGPLEIGFDSCLLLPTTNDRVPRIPHERFSITCRTIPASGTIFR